MDELIRLSEEKFSKILDNISDVIVIVNAKGQIVYKSSNIHKIFGWQPEELFGNDVFENIHPDDLIGVRNFYTPIIQTPGASGSIECRYKCKDGSYKWILFTGKNLILDKDINGILGSYHDISDKKKVENAVQERETLFKALFQNLTSSSSLYQVVFDDHGEPVDYRFITVNPAYEENIGYKEEYVTGKTLLELFPKTEEVWLEALKNVCKTGEPLKVENYSKEVNKYFELIVYRPKIDLLAMIGSDITERKLHELEIIKAKEKAEESDQLKSAFLQNMSHEIRTPLNAICGFSNFLKNPDLTSNKKHEFISIINNSSVQLLSILDDILAISSIETKQEKIVADEFDLNEVIDQLYEIFSLQLTGKEISFITKKGLPVEQSQIITDKTKVTQVLVNLINNSIKFTPKGRIEIGYVLKDSFLEFFVKDTGIGIKKELHKIIFERFRQADISISRKYGGSGLGLSIAKGYVELLGGSIRVESEIEQGACFIFTIPYKHVKQYETTYVKTEIINERCYTILVAEDEDLNYYFIQHVLSKYNYNILWAKDGEEAVEICKTHKVDLVLMDIKMPKMDGYIAAKIINDFYSEIPIIAQTAYALDTDIKRFKDAFVDYLTKPISEEILLDAINKCLKVK